MINEGGSPYKGGEEIGDPEGERLEKKGVPGRLAVREE